jgi:hypothetical protein
LRRKLRRKGITVNTIQELMERGIGKESKVVDLDFDPNDLSMESEYLAKIKYETDVLSLPIEERRRSKPSALRVSIRINRFEPVWIHSISDLAIHGQPTDYFSFLQQQWRRRSERIERAFTSELAAI